MMIKILWLQAVKGAWTAYVSKINNSIRPHNMDSYLSQRIDMGMTLEEFGEMVFIEGFVAGEKYTQASMPGTGARDANLN